MRLLKQVQFLAHLRMENVLFIRAIQSVLLISGLSQCDGLWELRSPHAGRSLDVELGPDLEAGTGRPEGVSFQQSQNPCPQLTRGRY